MRTIAPSTSVTTFSPGGNLIKHLSLLLKLRQNKPESLLIPSLMFVGKAMGLSSGWGGAPERFFTELGSGLNCKHKSWLERLARDKPSSL